MTEMITLRAGEILAQLFSVILEEARAKPDFAARLVAALPGEVIARVEKAGIPKKATPRKKFDPDAFSLIAVLARQGESELRVKLKGIKTREHLKKLADAQHIPVERSLFENKKVGLDKIRDAIIAGTKRRTADQFAAAS